MTATERSARRREQEAHRLKVALLALLYVRDDATSIGQARKIAERALLTPPVSSDRDGTKCLT
jgi:hypothetical protein